MRDWCRGAVFAAIVAVSELQPCVVHAQEEALAEALFRDGRESMKRGDPEAACPKFAESLRLDRAPGTLLNLAVCERKRGRLATAWARFQDFVDSVAESDPRVPPARRAIAELDPLLSRFTVTVVAGSGNVHLDGVELQEGSWGAPLPIDPGEHRVTLRDRDRILDEESFVAVTAEQVHVYLEGPPEDASSSDGTRAAPIAPSTAAKTALTNAAPLPEPEGRRGTGPSPSPPRPYRTAAYWAGGVGLVGLTAAGVFGAMALHEKGIVDDECTGSVCSPEGMEATERGARNLRLLDVSAVIGIIGIGTAGALFGIDAMTPVQVSATQNMAMIQYRGILQ